jgi:hypothetical protein
MRDFGVVALIFSTGALLAFMLVRFALHEWQRQAHVREAIRHAPPEEVKRHGLRMLVLAAVATAALLLLRLL